MNKLTLTVGVALLAACHTTSTADDLGHQEHGESGSDSAATESEGGESTETTTDDAGTDTTDTTDTETGEDPACGNGILEADEACDDGNDEADDGCTNDCTLPMCGDAIVQAGEGCDDGNDIDDDECSNECVLETCGNGVLDPGEECEDGDMEPNDGCTNACIFATCGDGIVWSGYEECDDGNAIDEDACTSTCDAAACGDGFVQPGEECEDGNELANDGCYACLEQRVVQLSGGICGHTCALLDTGNVRCWGSNTNGRLGYGSIANIGDDEHVYTAGDVNVGGPVVQISAGCTHTCALLDTGNVRCWGQGQYGVLGYGNEDIIGDDEDPATAGDVNVGGAVLQVSAGTRGTCALLEGGAVRCWGYGPWGKLGYGNVNNIGDDEEPIAAGDVDVGGAVVQVSTSSTHTCALLESGGVKCWGLADDGRLGYGQNTDIGIDDVPADWGEINLGGAAVQLATGQDHTCALLDTGAVRCWGKGQYGALGYGNSLNVGDNEAPAAVGDVNVGGVVTQISLGIQRTCARLEGGSVRCWGRGASGALGYGNMNDIGDNEQPVVAGDVNVGGFVDSVGAGGVHVCVILDLGTVRCWGRNSSGELGYSHVNIIGDNELPVSAGNVQIF